MASPLHPPRRFPSRTPRILGRSRHAFSLVEVVVALGLVSFSIIGLLGLMSSGLDVIRGASEESAISTIAKTLTAQIQQNSLDNIMATTFTDRYFNAEGQEVTNSNPLVVYRALARAEGYADGIQLTGPSQSPTLVKITVSIYHYPGVLSPKVWISYVAKN